MAILEKRKAVNKLPRFERYQDTRVGDRAAALRGEPPRLRSEAPITSAIRQLAGSSGYGPMSDQGFNQMGGRPPYSMGEDGRGLPPDMGGAGRATVDKFGNTAGQPQTAVTSALKGSTGAGATAGKATGTGATVGATAGATAGKVAGTTASKLPGLTSKVATDAKTDATKAATGAKTITTTGADKTATGAKTLTSTGSGTTKTAGISGTKPAGSSIGNTLTSALAGAALGAGTKFVIDKLTGTKKAADTGAGTVAGTNKVAGTGKVAGAVAGTGLTSKTNPYGTNIGKDIVDTGVQKAIDASKKITVPTSVVKGADPAAKTNPAGAKLPTGAKPPVTTGAKAPVTTGAKAPVLTSTTRGLGAAKDATKSDNTLKGDPVVTGVAYDDDGNLMPGYELDENGNPVFVGDNDSSTTYNPDGSTGVVSTGVAYDEDGNLMPGYELDENGDAVFVGDATSTIYDPSGGSITSDTKTIDNLDAVTDTVIDNVENNDGTTTTVYADGSTVTRDGTGSVVDASDPVDASGGGDSGSIVETVGDSGGLFSDTDGNLYDAEGNLVQYADGTKVGDEVTEEDSFDNEVAFTDENGDTYNASGVLLSEGDHSDYVYTAEDGSTYDYDGNLITEADHSGFVQYDAAGNSFDYDGNIISYADGYGAQDEYAANDEYSADDEFKDEDLYGAKGGLTSMKRGGGAEDGEPISEEDNGDGTITQMFDDGSSIIYNQDGEVVKVAEAKGYADGDLVSKYSDDQIEEERPNPAPTQDEMRRMMQDSVTLRYLNEDLYARTGQSYDTIEEAEAAKQRLDYESSDEEAKAERIKQREVPDEIQPIPERQPQPNPEDYDPHALIREEENEDGTITQYFDDGSSITYDANGGYVVTEADDPYANFGGKDVYSDPLNRGFGSALPPNNDPYAEFGGRDAYSDPLTKGFGSAFPTEIDQSYGSTNDAPLQGRSPVTPYLTADQVGEIIRDNAIARNIESSDMIEREFNEAEALDKYRVDNGLEPLNKGFASTSVPASEQNLQGKKYFSDGSYIYFDKYGTPVQTGDVDGKLSFYDPSKKPIVNSEATATLARNPNYSDTTEEVQDFQNVGYTGTGNRNPVGNAVNTSPPEGWPVGFKNNYDGTATYVDPEDGSTVTIDADNNIVFVTDAKGETVAQDNEPVTTTGGLTQANQGIKYFDDGSYIQTFDDGTSITFDSDGNPFRSTDTEGNSQLATKTTYDDEGNKTISDYYGNIVKVLDPQGNVIPLGGGRVNTAPVTSTGGTGAVKTELPEVADPKVGSDTKSAIDKLLAGLNTYGGAGAAGAVLGGLLGNSDLFGGGGGGSSFDMGGYGAIDPRTTDFGIGPANYVGYDEYGTPEEMPELYGNELYQNLNAPGFNEVNPGDYARMDEEEFGPEPMAEGGMPQGGLGQTYPQTYYTFGKPVDPLQNLRNPMPFQHQQPQMPPQAAQQAPQMPQGAPQGMQPMPQGMPQMGMPPQMRRGGLPHASSVPMTQGRMDFRRGSAVHGAGDGQSDDIPAMLADGEYVLDAELVAQIGNGSTKAGAEALDRFRENIRAHKRSAPVNKIPPKTKALTSYLKGAR